MGYPISTFKMGDVFGCGRELALHKVYEEIDFINTVNRYGYECERLDIDITSTYFEGEERVLAEFGHP